MSAALRIYEAVEAAETYEPASKHTGQYTRRQEDGTRRPAMHDNQEHAPACFGEWVSRTRKARGMTQRQLAGKLGVSQPVVSRIEKDARVPPDRRAGPDLDTVYRYAEALAAADEEALAAAGYLVGAGGVILTDPFATLTGCEAAEDALSPERIEIGQRIRRARGAKGLTLQDVASQLGGVTTETAARWERGTTRISAERLKHLCALLGVSSDWMLWGPNAPDWAKESAPSPAATQQQMASFLRAVQETLSTFLDRPTEPETKEKE